MKQNAAIFYLTQNTDVRRTYLKTSLYFLFRHLNADHKYQVIILHEGDYDSKSQEEIIMSIRDSCRGCVTFRALDPDDFKIPSHIDTHKMTNCIDLKVVPYWRNEKYRMMCRWWLIHFPKYTKGYEYVMRLDDDSIIEEPIPDIFSWMNEKKLVYASNFVHTDCGICCYGMKEFFNKMCPTQKEHIDKLFIPQEVPTKSFQLFKFRSLLSITQSPEIQLNDKIMLQMPIMYYNNFFMTRTDFWEKPEVKKIINEIDMNGSIFYFRWGDAPLQTLIVKLFAKENEVSRSIFKYSKRMQREAFQGNDGKFQSYIPATYDESSCMSGQIKI
jgi:alpha 1,2-mannosyltransferase